MYTRMGGGRCFFDSLYDCMLSCWVVKQHMFQLHACWVMKIILGQKGSLGQMRDAVCVIKCHFSTGKYRDRYPKMFARIKVIVKISRWFKMYANYMSTICKRLYIIFHMCIFLLRIMIKPHFHWRAPCWTFHNLAPAFFIPSRTPWVPWAGRKSIGTHRKAVGIHQLESSCQLCLATGCFGWEHGEAAAALAGRDLCHSRVWRHAESRMNAVRCILGIFGWWRSMMV